MLKLQHKTVFITYATTNSGQATAQRFAALGARIILHDLAGNNNLIQKLLSDIRAMGAGVVTMVTDLKNNDTLEAVLKQSLGNLKKIDIIVINPGTASLNLHLLEFAVDNVADNGRIIYIMPEEDFKSISEIMDNIRKLAFDNRLRGVTINAIIPQNALFTTPTEGIHISDAAEFFASDLSDLISGQSLVINGILDN